MAHLSSTTAVTLFGASSRSWTHTIEAGAKRIIVRIGGILPLTGMTATCNGTSMTKIGEIASGSASFNIHAILFSLDNPPTGAQTIQVDSGGPTNWAGVANSSTYDSLGAFDTPSTGTGTSNTSTRTVSSATGSVVIDVIGFNSGTLSSNSGTTRLTFTSDAGYIGAGQDTDGATSVNMTWTVGSPDVYSHLAVSMAQGTPAPTITTQPQGAGAAVGGTAQFSVVSSDATSYQWQVSTNRGISWSNVTDGSGGTTATYTTPTAIASHNGRKYRCVLTNAGGNTNSFDVFFHVSGLGRAGRSTNRGFPDAQTFEGRLERSGAFAPGTWYAFRSISGTNNRDFAAAARQAYFPELVIDPPSLAIWSNKLKADLPSKYGTPLSTLRQRGMPAALLVANNVVVGTLSVTNFGDIVVAAGTTTVLATLAKTNNNDTVSGNGNTTIVGTASTTNTNDVVSASGTVTVIGNLAKTNADDTISATGSVGSSSTGSVNVTNQNDTLSAAGSPVTIGSGSTTNQNDTLAATGSSGSAVSGSLATTNANDTLSAAGTTTVTGSSSNTNNNDTVASIGTTTVVGSLSRTNNNDTLAASGASGTPPAGGSSTRLPLTGAGQT